MPTYDYRCKACGQEREVFQSFSDDPLTTCDACGGELRKLFGAPGIAFKGSGFYKNDSRGSKRSATSSPSSESSSSDSSTSEQTSGDKKPDTKPDTKSDTSSNGAASPKKAAAGSAKTDS